MKMLFIHEFGQQVSNNYLLVFTDKVNPAIIRRRAYVRLQEFFILTWSNQTKPDAAEDNEY